MEVAHNMLDSKIMPDITQIDIKRHSLKSLSIGVRFVIRLRKAASELKVPDEHIGYTLRAVNGDTLSVNLSPARSDDECPLTLGPISEDNLDFLDGTTFILDKPNFKRLTLPCGHSFGAMNMIYQFARQNMLCPCCRAGVNGAIHNESVPSHFREALCQSVLSSQQCTESLQEDVCESVREDMLDNDCVPTDQSR